MIPLEGQNNCLLLHCVREQLNWIQCRVVNVSHFNSSWCRCKTSSATIIFHMSDGWLRSIYGSVYIQNKCTRVKYISKNEWFSTLVVITKIRHKSNQNYDHAMLPAAAATVDTSLCGFTNYKIFKRKNTVLLFAFPCSSCKNLVLKCAQQFTQ